MRFKKPLTDKSKSERLQWNTSWTAQNCSNDTKEKSGRSSTKLRSRRTSHQETGEKSESTSSTKMVTEDAGNCRPICSLPVLYKLFATVLYARLAPGLHRVQPPDQAGFRPNHRCDDHLVVYRVLEKRCREWGVPLYISTIDFTTAFDRIKHLAIWSSLQFYGIKQHTWDYCNGSKTSKKEQFWQTKRATHFPSNEERSKVIHCLFYSSTQYCNIHWKVIWSGGRRNEKLSAWATKQRTASRIWDLLTTRFSSPCRWKITWNALRVQDQHRNCGSGNSHRQNKSSQQPGQSEHKIDHGQQNQIEVLAKGDSARYLGQKITFEDQGAEEIKNRLKAAWSAFHKYRQEVTSKDYRLCHRLRLFNMVTTQTMTYACGTWTLTQKHEMMIKNAQRKMLRLIVQRKGYTNQKCYSQQKRWGHR